MQVTARSTDDLSPEGIIRKVADASGSKYSGGGQPTDTRGPAPPVASKPVFTPSRIGGGGGSGFNPLSSRSRQAPARDVDEDGWGQDAPPVTRSQLEKVGSAYKPTKVDMNALTSQKQEPSRLTPAARNDAADQSNAIRGGYQPIGKVDIAAIRHQAKDSGTKTDDRPAPVKGSYEPVGKVDIAAIRARAQPSQGAGSPAASSISPAQTGASATSNGADEEPKSLADRSSAFSQSERMSSMPRPKVANKFGSSGFTGTTAPTPGGFGATSAASTAAPIGTASKTFADEGGKTPAQIWAEKKARQRGYSGAAETTRPAASLSSQTSGSGAWESGYSGKKWGSVQTTKTGQSGVSQQRTGEEPGQEEEASAAGGAGALRDRFKGAPPMGASTTGDHDTQDERFSHPPPMDMSSKPSASRGVAMPGLPSRGGHAEEEEVNIPPPPAVPRTPTPEDDEPEMRPSSPIRIAQPVARTEEKPMERAEEAPLMPTRSLAQSVPQAHELDDEPLAEADDPARAAGQAAAESEFGAHAVNDAETSAGAHAAGKRALIQYDYEKAEDNELELTEGEYVTNIEMVDEDWWMGQNSRGESGLFPSNYVELQEDEPAAGRAPEPKAATRAPAAAEAPTAVQSAGGGKTAVAQYDYEAAEDNELSFPEGAKITNVVSHGSAALPLHPLQFILPGADIGTRNFRMRIGG